MLGAIEPMEGEPFPVDDWLALIESHPSLTKVPSLEGKNPFTGKPMMFHPPATTARVVDQDESIGTLELAPEDGAPGLLVTLKSEDPSALPTLMGVVLDITQRLGGVFKKLEEREG